MRDAQEIHIGGLIVHVLEPGGLNLVLSTRELPLDDNPQLVEYCRNHISGGLSDNATRAARFRNVNPAQPSGVCRAMLGGEESLLDGSRQLAGSLYRIQENDSRISPGDLCVGFYQAGNYPGLYFLAILKLESSTVLRRVIRKLNGETYVTYEPEFHAYTGERLQKSAFVQAAATREADYDLLLLDRQRRGEAAPVAKFFSQTFLDTEQAFDPRRHSEELYKSLVRAQEQVKPQLDPQQEEELDQRIRQAVTSRRINLDGWLEGLPLPEVVVGAIDGELRQNIPDREFELDRDFAESLVQKRRYRGDYGLRLEVQAEHYREVIVAEQTIHDDPERGPFHRITIETQTWRRLS